VAVHDRQLEWFNIVFEEYPYKSTGGEEGRTWDGVASAAVVGGVRLLGHGVLICFDYFPAKIVCDVYCWYNR
jgi:hypothetical protein